MPDEIVMRLVDGLRVFPSIILVIAMVAAAGPSLLNIVIVMGLLDAPVFVRLVRAEVLALRATIMSRPLSPWAIRRGVSCLVTYCPMQ